MHRNEIRLPLDLNKPEDARTYIQAWVDHGDFRFQSPGGPKLLEEGTDEDLLRVAKQLFLYADERPVSGSFVWAN